MMMAKSNRFSGGYCRNAVETVDESEGSGSSGRIDTELTVSEDSSFPTKKCSSLNSIHCDTYGVPIQILPLSNISPFERKDLVHKLRSELEQLQLLLKKVDSQRTNGVTLSSSSDMLSCSNGHNKPQIGNSRKQSIPGSVPGKKPNATGQKPHGWNRGSSGKFETATQSCSPRTANALLMKQCETLLKRLMNHQYAWVFNTPVDVVKLNLPDYFSIIKHPIDLGTIKCKIASGAYSGPLEFVADVRLTFWNAMTYNPPGNDVHIMADALGKYFEVRWKAIEKKMPKINALPLQGKPGTCENVQTATRPPSKKSRIAPLPSCPEVMPPAKQVMTDEEKHNLGMELESLLGELPGHIIDFLKEHSSNGGECGEDEIDIDDLCDDTLFSLRKLLDGYLQEKQRNNAKVKLCEIEFLNDSGPSNSSLQPFKGDDLGDEDADIGRIEPPVLTYSPVEIAKDATYIINKRLSPGSFRDADSSSSDCESDDAKAGPVNESKVLKNLDTGAPLEEKTSVFDTLERKQKARVEAEAKAAEDARRQAEAEAAAEAQRKRELER